MYFLPKVYFWSYLCNYKVLVNSVTYADNSRLSGYYYVARWFSKGLLRKLRTEVTSIFFALDFVPRDFNFFQAKAFLRSLRLFFA